MEGTASESRPTVSIGALRGAQRSLLAAYAEAALSLQRTWWRRLWGLPLLNAHVKSRARELRDAYIRARETDLRGTRDAAFVDEAIEDLDEFASTFRERPVVQHVAPLVGGLTAFWGLPGVAAVAGVTGLSAAVLGLIRACLCHLVGIAILATAAAVVCTFIVGYFQKRHALSQTKDGSAYALEDGLFERLGALKRPEPRLDAIGCGLASAVLFAGAFFMHVLIDAGFFSNPRGVPTLLTLGVILALVAVLLAVVARPQR